ncbi:hypothetical protein, partial [Microbacterium sp. K33]|uniref:hypothetical protein n=1 Tax=Microbacterium sp. K33 TaxID=2305441 RepID=UPI00197B554E
MLEAMQERQVDLPELGLMALNTSDLVFYDQPYDAEQLSRITNSPVATTAPPRRGNVGHEA